MSDSESGPTAGRRRNAARRRAPDHGATGADVEAAGSGPLGSGESRRVRKRRAGQERRDDSGWQPLTLDAVSRRRVFARAGAARRGSSPPASSRRRSYSKFKVGAALETVDGVIVTGCNIENATYGLTLCAERVALVKALSEGHTAFTRIAVVADTEAPTPPCGPCRQLLWEYCGDIEVMLGNRVSSPASIASPRCCRCLSIAGSCNGCSVSVLGAECTKQPLNPS